MFRKVKFWAIVLPIALFIMLLISTQKMFSLRSQAENKVEVALAARHNVQRILEMREKLGEETVVASATTTYNGIASAVYCAENSGISKNNLIRGESTKPRKRKEGGYLHQENYKLNNITILQAAKYIDHAEQDFSGVNCKELTLSHVRSQNKDIWNATVVLEYITQ
jgi:hypothetical protein